MFAVYATHAAPDDPLSALKVGEMPETECAQGMRAREDQPRQPESPRSLHAAWNKRASRRHHLSDHLGQ